MKPLLIFRHIACDQAGFLCHFLAQRQIPFELNCISEGDSLCYDLEQASGLIFLGAASSVNESATWIAQEIELIQNAIRQEVPVMGACFGGQLIARALGAEVLANVQTQIGWLPVNVTAEGRSILAGSALPDSFHVFEWHEEGFLLPEGATPLFTDAYGSLQGFLHGKCFSMQFHLEMTRALIESSLNQFSHCLPPVNETIQSSEQILVHTEVYLRQMHQIAESLYGWWLDQLDLS